MLKYLQDETTWFPELQELGYPGNDEGIVPSPAVQAVLSSIAGQDFHDLVIRLDKAAVEDRNVDGSLPQILDILALDDWLKLAHAYKCKPEEGLEKLTKVHALLPRMVEADETATKAAEELRISISKALGACFSACEGDAIQDTFKDDSFHHPLLSTTAATSAEKQALLEETRDSQIHDSQAALREQSPVPVIPPRDLEAELSKWGHRSWASWTSNFLAPLNTRSWQMLCSVSDAELGAVHAYALTGQLALSNSVSMACSHRMNIFDVVPYFLWYPARRIF